LSSTSESLIDLKEAIPKAIANYNKFRSPEATAKLISLEKNRFTVQFSGPFCYSCGLDAYFEDFIYKLYQLASNRFSVEITQIRQTSPESYDVQYKVLCKS